jgi:hypothetical protein
MEPVIRWTLLKQDICGHSCCWKSLARPMHWRRNYVKMMFAVDCKGSVSTSVYTEKLNMDFVQLTY